MEGIGSKLRDALAMFWLNLDDDERRLLAYAGCYLAASVLLAWQRSSRERLKRELRDEMIFAIGAGDGR